MKKKNKKILLIGVISLVVIALFLWSFGFLNSALSGEASPFVFQSMECDGSSGCHPEGYTARNNIDIPDDEHYKSAGENHIYGFIETIPKCGQYVISGYISNNGKHCTPTSTYTRIYVNNVEVVEGYRDVGYNSKGNQGYYGFIDVYNSPRLEKSQTFSNVDVTNLVGGQGNVSIKVISQARMWDNTEYACGTSFSSLNIVSSECIGDRLFTRTCPLWNNYSVMGKEFKSGENISLSSLPNDSYFCASQPAIVKDSNNQVIGSDKNVYVTLNNNGVFQVPEGQSYILIFASAKNDDAKIQSLNVIIDQYASDLISKLDFINQQNITLQNYGILIGQNQVTIDSMLEIALKQNLTIQDLKIQLALYGKELEFTSSQILELKSKNELMLQDYLNLQTNSDKLARDLKIAYDSNAELGQALGEVRLKYTQYAEVLDIIGATVDDNSQIIGHMNKTNDEIILIVSNLKKSFVEQQRILNATIKDLNDLKAGYNLLKEKNDFLIKNNDLLQQNLDIVNQANLNLEQALADRSKQDFYNQIYKYGFITAVVLLIGMFIYFKFKKKSRRKR